MPVILVCAAYNWLFVETVSRNPASLDGLGHIKQGLGHLHIPNYPMGRKSYWGRDASMRPMRQV